MVVPIGVDQDGSFLFQTHEYRLRYLSRYYHTVRHNSTLPAELLCKHAISYPLVKSVTSLS
jgi:hypothetical protein